MMTLGRPRFRLASELTIVWILVLGAWLGGGSCRDAQACSPTGETLEEMVANSDIVVQGLIVRTDYVPGGPWPPAHFVHTLRAQVYWKDASGAYEREVKFIDVQGMCEIGMAAGETWRLVGWKGSDGTYSSELFVGACMLGPYYDSYCLSGLGEPAVVPVASEHTWSTIKASC